MKYTPRVRYTPRRLLLENMRDLVADLRFERRTGRHPEYAAQLEREIRRNFKGRHGARVGRHGETVVTFTGNE